MDEVEDKRLLWQSAFVEYQKASKNLDDAESVVKFARKNVEMAHKHMNDAAKAFDDVVRKQHNLKTLLA